MTTYTDQDSVRDGYPQFELAVEERFAGFRKTHPNLFKTDATELFTLFLENLPAESRDHYTCNACRSFFNRYGGLAIVHPDGESESPIWNVEVVPQFFKPAVLALQKRILQARINGVFLSSEKTLGTPHTGSYSHLFVKLSDSQLYRSRVNTASQAMAEKKEEFLMLTNALLEFKIETVDQALRLIRSEALYRSDKVLGVAEWFKDVIERTTSTANLQHRNNLVWLAVATAPKGFTHIRSSMIGTLLEDINKGTLSSEAIARRFAEKMSPANYMRAQTAPTESGIQQAEKLVDQLGIANSLRRRYATMGEFPITHWVPGAIKGSLPSEQMQKKETVFGHLKPKGHVIQNPLVMPTATMTWEKFQRTMLPDAEKLEVMIDNPTRFVAMVTAADSEAENIMQWDNPFSWYYHGGIDGEIKRRVEDAGGRYENNEIRASLIWNGHTDLDIHVMTPNREVIYFGNDRGRCGGRLDVDANGGHDRRDYPVENIRWGRSAPEGRYQVHVHNYAERTGGNTAYTVELEVNGETFTQHGVATRTGYKEAAFVFDYSRANGLTMISDGHTKGAGDWNVETGTFVDVKAITLSPNMWVNQHPQAGTHVFFLLDGVRDLSEGKGRGFFTEMLKPELREIRRTLELYTANTPIEGAEEADACGVGYTKDGEWNARVRVTTGGHTQIIKIDRWD